MSGLQQDGAKFTSGRTDLGQVTLIRDDATEDVLPIVVAKGSITKDGDTYTITTEE